MAGYREIPSAAGTLKIITIFLVYKNNFHQRNIMIKEMLLDTFQGIYKSVS